MDCDCDSLLGVCFSFTANFGPLLTNFRICLQHLNVIFCHLQACLVFIISPSLADFPVEDHEVCVLVLWSYSPVLSPAVYNYLRKEKQTNKLQL